MYVTIDCFLYFQLQIWFGATKLHKYSITGYICVLWDFSSYNNFFALNNLGKLLQKKKEKAGPYKKKITWDEIHPY